MALQEQNYWFRTAEFPKPKAPRLPQGVDVAVIGAGPYGLSVAAHLKHAGVATQVFGEPMAFWRQNMPKGMMLRSPWRGTHISQPDGTLSLDAYAVERSVDANKLLPLEKFVEYGEWLQQRVVPDVDRRAVRLVEAAAVPGLRLRRLPMFRAALERIG